MTHDWRNACRNKLSCYLRSSRERTSSRLIEAGAGIRICGFLKHRQTAELDARLRGRKSHLELPSRNISSAKGVCITIAR